MTDYRQIEGWPYSVSNDGKVRNDRTGYILKPSLVGGYPYTHLWNKGKSAGVLIHRLVASAFVPNPFGKPEVNHIDGTGFVHHGIALTWMLGMKKMFLL